DLALHAAIQASNLAPSAANIAELVARSRLACGDYDAALLAYRRVLELRPKHYAAMCKLGKLLHNKGESVEALRVLSKAESLRPRKKEAQKIIQEIRSALRMN